MVTAVLEARHLSRVHQSANGSKHLLLDICFQLQQGQVMAILGPSGAGKTTLLRLLNRLDEPTSGELWLQGEDYRKLDPTELRRKVGMVMQRPYLFPGSVAQNVGYGPEQRGTSLSPAQIENLLHQVGMAGYATRDVATLSGGEAQRISIARALANEPEVLLLDEPTSSLDPDAKQSIEQLLKVLVRERTMTCVWVTHDLEQASRVADFALRIHSGKAVDSANPQEFLRA